MVAVGPARVPFLLMVDHGPPSAVDTPHHPAAAGAGAAAYLAPARDIAVLDLDRRLFQGLRAIHGRLVAAQHEGRDGTVAADHPRVADGGERLAVSAGAGAVVETPAGEVAACHEVARPANAGETGVTAQGTGAEWLPLLLQFITRGANRLMVQALKTGLDHPNMRVQQVLPTR